MDVGGSFEQSAGARLRGNVWIGVDIGTQSVRVLALRDDGVVLGAGSRPLTSRRDGNRHEQEAAEWWEALCSATREALAATQPRAVRGLCVAATSGTVLLADTSGRPLTPALMYDDGRAARVRARQPGRRRALA